MLAKLGQRQLWTGDDAFVFVSPTGNYIDYSATVKAYKRALKKAGLDIKTTMRYVHHVPKHDAAERLGRVLEGKTLPQTLPQTPVPGGHRE